MTSDSCRWRKKVWKNSPACSIRRTFTGVNRRYLVNREAIREIEYYFNGRLSVRLLPESGEKILISKAKSGSFKEWMGGESRG